MIERDYIVSVYTLFFKFLHIIPSTFPSYQNVKSQTSISPLLLCSSLLPSIQEGQQLIQEKPELSPVVRRKLEEIRECWQDLESTTQAKARQLFEANKADLLVQSYESLDQRLGQLEGQLVYVDQGQDLTTVNKQLKKLHVRRI